MSGQEPDGAKLRFFVTGTDTGAGKTVVCAALARCLMAAGKTVSAIKPFQTGCAAGDTTDAEFVHLVMGKSFNPERANPYSLQEPLAPMMAAEIENTGFDIQKLLTLIKEETENHDAVIVEGAGGLLVPIRDDYSMADFAAELGFRTVIAARAGLGTINHTLLTVEGARARNLEIAGVVICGYPEQESVCEETNLDFLSSRARVAGVVPFIRGLNVEKGRPETLAERDCRSFFTPDLLGTLDEKNLVLR